MMAFFYYCILAAGAFLAYVFTSAFLWHHPHLLHRKKRIAFVSTHISHRGGAAEGYENTIRAFSRAVGCGTDMLELDVRLTRDEQVVVFHDPDLRRVTGSPLRISDVVYDQLPGLNAKVPIDTIPGEFFSDSTWSQGDRKIPLLRHVFSQFPHVPINIDIKDHDARLVAKVSDLIKEFNRKDITVWGSFNDAICQLCHKTNPEVGLFFSQKRVLLLLIWAVTGILPFVPLKETHYEVFLPLALKRRRQRMGTPLTILEKMMLYLSESFLLWNPMINHLRKRGLHIYLWVCNSDDEYAQCFELGVTGVMTDYPSRLRQFLDANNVQKENGNEKPLPRNS